MDLCYRDNDCVIVGRSDVRFRIEFSLRGATWRIQFSSIKTNVNTHYTTLYVYVIDFIICINDTMCIF